MLNILDTMRAPASRAAVSLREVGGFMAAEATTESEGPNMIIRSLVSALSIAGCVHGGKGQAREPCVLKLRAANIKFTLTLVASQQCRRGQGR